MRTYNKKQLIEIFEEEAISAKQLPKNDRYKTDVAILKMLQKVNNDFVATFEEGRGGLPNRGSLVECIVKHLINKIDEVSKSQKGVKDIKVNHKICELSRLSYEIKFATTYANASILNNSNHVSTKNFANATRLDELSELLGL